MGTEEVETTFDSIAPKDLLAKKEDVQGVGIQLIWTQLVEARAERAKACEERDQARADLEDVRGKAEAAKDLHHKKLGEVAADGVKFRDAAIDLAARVSALKKNLYFADIVSGVGGLLLAVGARFVSWEHPEYGLIVILGGLLIVAALVVHRGLKLQSSSSESMVATELKKGAE